MPCFDISTLPTDFERFSFTFSVSMCVCVCVCVWCVQNYSHVPFFLVREEVSWVLL
jgi:hypothetical protein